MTEFLPPGFEGLGPYLINVGIAVVILVVGWIIAVLARGATGWVMRRTGLDRRLREATGDGDGAGANVTGWVSRGVYYLVLLLVLVGVLQQLQFTGAAESIQVFLDEIFRFLPSILWAAVLLLVAWIVASILRYLVTRGLNAVGLDDWLSRQADVPTPDATQVSETLGTVVYWLVFLVFLPAIIGVLGLEGLLEPVQNVVNEVLGALPGIFSAGLILLLGWIAARIIRQVITNLLVSAGLDRLSEQWGIQEALGDLTLTGIVGTVVYVLILVPVGIAALDELEIAAVSGPASEALNSVLTAIPAILGAILLLAVAYFVARVVRRFVTNALTGVGFDSVLGMIGLGGTDRPGGRTPSEIVGYLASLAILLFAVLNVSELLGAGILAELISDFLIAAGGVLTGIVIFGLGLYFARLADRVIRDTGGAMADTLAPVARVAIIVFSGALALRQTGIGEDIVNIAFGIVLGAVAIAAALAFGLGGRDAAAKQIDSWSKRFNE